MILYFINNTKLSFMYNFLIMGFAFSISITGIFYYMERSLREVFYEMSKMTRLNEDYYLLIKEIIPTSICIVQEISKENLNNK